MLGTDFLEQHGAVIDFINNNLLLQYNRKTVRIPLSRTSSISVHLPARTEVITYVECTDKEEGEVVVLNNEIAPSVYIANSLGKVINAKYPLK